MLDRFPHIAKEVQLRLDELRREPRDKRATDNPHNYVNGLIDLIDAVKPNSVLEIGCHEGVSTEVFLLKVPRVVAVDYWPDLLWTGRREYANGWPWETPWEIFQARCFKYPNLEICKGKSPAALHQFADGEFDLVYIDAAHDFQSVLADICAALRIVKADGAIAGHDHWMAPVSEAVAAQLKVTPQVFGDTSWLVRMADVKAPSL